MKAPSWKEFAPKLIAILRGIKTDEVEPIVTALIDEGFRAIEIPLNSPDPITSIGRAVKIAQERLGQDCLIGAGTVLKVDEVDAIHGVGGNLIVSPNVNPAVIKRTVELGMVSLPGVFTPTEAHLALDSGASGLKFFPASMIGPSGIKAIKAILPTTASICAVGGAGPANFDEFVAVGVEGFGLGSDLYKPGFTAGKVQERARIAITTYSAQSD